jgi:hypothetical protein
MISTYELFGGTDRQGLTARAINALNNARVESKQRPVALVTEAMQEAERAATALEDRNNDPNQVAQRALQQVVERTQRGAQSWIIPVERADFDTIDFPQELLQQDNATLGLSVGFYRDDASPWGAYYLLVFVLGGGQSV